jgi:hypothetical protein
VTQSDDLIATLTVHEYLHFSANLRLPSSISRAEKKVIVDTTMHEMGLHECANIHVGNWHLRGLSGGEKRRLSIALEILTRPRLLFLDEPTSGLDRWVVVLKPVGKNLFHNHNLRLGFNHNLQGDSFFGNLNLRLWTHQFYKEIASWSSESQIRFNQSTRRLSLGIPNFILGFIQSANSYVWNFSTFSVASLPDLHGTNSLLGQEPLEIKYQIWGLWQT